MVILGWNGGESNTGVYAGDALIKSPLRGGTFLAIDFHEEGVILDPPERLQQGLEGPENVRKYACWWVNSENKRIR